MAELAWEVARHLPYLRRYARAIVGDRARGDADVRTCLAQLLPQRATLGGCDLRLTLYRALHELWQQDGLERPCGLLDELVLENHEIVAARVGRLSPHQRQILVLTVLEGFSLAEAATITGLSLPAAEALLGQAKEELRRQKASRILVIEDEPIIALDIASTLRQSGHTLVGVAATHREAVEVAGRETPELILADIQLADGSSGLEAVSEILTDRYLPVVFITAFPERLLTGSCPEPTLLITKPFDADILKVSISQALALGSEERRRVLQ